MKTGTIEIYKDYMTIQIPCDDVTVDIESRLFNDGWVLSTNGHCEFGKCYNIYCKNI